MINFHCAAILHILPYSVSLTYQLMQDYITHCYKHNILHHFPITVTLYSLHVNKYSVEFDIQRTVHRDIFL